MAFGQAHGFPLEYSERLYAKYVSFNHRAIHGGARRTVQRGTTKWEKEKKCVTATAATVVSRRRLRAAITRRPRRQAARQAGGRTGAVYRLNFAAAAIGRGARRAPIAAAPARDVTGAV